MRGTQIALGGMLIGCSMVAWGSFFSQGAIAQSCVAQTSCPSQPIQFTPGSWVHFEVINATGNIINIEDPQSTNPIALSPGQTIRLGGTTTQNASLIFWDVQGLSVQAHVRQTAPNTLRIELRWGNGFGNYGLYLRDDGRIELL